MNAICPYSEKICMLGCEPLCCKPDVSYAALKMPEPKNAWKMPLSEWAEENADFIDMEIDLEEETFKATINIPL